MKISRSDINENTKVKRCELVIEEIIEIIQGIRLFDSFYFVAK